MTGDYRMVLDIAAADGAVVARRAWPFGHPPTRGDHVLTPLLGWETPQELPVRQVRWHPVAGVCDVLFYQQRTLEGEFADEVVRFYSELGWDVEVHRNKRSQQ